jgi:hypothetical protein
MNTVRVAVVRAMLPDTETASLGVSRIGNEVAA